MRSIDRFTVNGNVGSVTSFEKAAKVNVATDRSWTDDAGEKQTKTDWVTVTILDERQAAWVVGTLRRVSRSLRKDGSAIRLMRRRVKPYILPI